MKPSKICLACPRSCNLRPQIEGVPGQRLCPKGEEFLKQEFSEPMRHYFSTVRLDDGKLYAYRTLTEIPFNNISGFCENLKRAASPQQRNKLHQQFCHEHKVELTCIDFDKQ